MRAMILAAGLGTRLRPLTDLMPKPLAPVLNKPVMEHIAELLAAHGFTEVIANLSYLPEQIRDAFGDGSAPRRRALLQRRARAARHRGRRRQGPRFPHRGRESFLVISGDALTDIDLRAMRSAHEAHVARRDRDARHQARQGHDAVRRRDHRGRRPRPGLPGEAGPRRGAAPTSPTAGSTCSAREIFDHFPGPGHRSPAGDDDQPEGFVDWAQDVFPALLDGDVPFHSHEIGAYWNDIGSIGEFTQGNFDALAGPVKLTPGPGRESRRRACRVPGCEIGAGAELPAPVVLGEGVAVGAGARLRECVVLGGSSVPGRGDGLRRRFRRRFVTHTAPRDVRARGTSSASPPRSSACSPRRAARSAAPDCHARRSLCGRCQTDLGAARPLIGEGPAGVDAVVAAGPHEGVVRSLATALKFGRRLPLAGRAAAAIRAAAPPSSCGGHWCPCRPTRCGCASAASTPRRKSPVRSRGSPSSTSTPASSVTRRAARSAAAAARGSPTRRGCAPGGRLRAPPCSSTTSGPPARRSARAPRRCARPAPSVSLRSPSPTQPLPDSAGRRSIFSPGRKEP